MPTVDRLTAKSNEPGGKNPCKKREEWGEWLAAGLERLRGKAPVSAWLVEGHFLEGRKVRDLAAEAGLTPNAVSCRLERGLKFLRELAARDGLDCGDLT